MRIVCQQTILMKYYALFVIFEKAAKFEIVVCCKLQVALYAVNFVTYILIFEGNTEWHSMRIVCQQTILMKYHSLFVIFEKAARFEIVVCCRLHVALYGLTIWWSEFIYSCRSFCSSSASCSSSESETWKARTQTRGEEKRIRRRRIFWRFWLLYCGGR